MDSVRSILLCALFARAAYLADSFLQYSARVSIYLEKTASSIDLYIHGLAEQLEAIPPFGARLALLFDLVLNLVEQRIEFAVQLKQGMIACYRCGTVLRQLKLADG